MRLFSFIFAFYFLLLAVIPCGDAFAHSEKESCMEQVCDSHVEAAESDHPEADTCTPLCMCNCCGGLTLVNEQLIVNAVPLYYSILNIRYSQQIPAEVSFSIWQPPKLG